CRRLRRPACGRHGSPGPQDPHPPQWMAWPARQPAPRPAGPKREGREYHAPAGHPALPLSRAWLRWPFHSSVSPSDKMMPKKYQLSSGKIKKYVEGLNLSAGWRIYPFYFNIAFTRVSHSSLSLLVIGIFLVLYARRSPYVGLFHRN